jgi:hypothetical protein
LGWELAYQALIHLTKIRSMALRAHGGQQHYEAVAEAIKQLATGPED